MEIITLEDAVKEYQRASRIHLETQYTLRSAQKELAECKERSSETRRAMDRARSRVLRLSGDDEVLTKIDELSMETRFGG